MEVYLDWDTWPCFCALAALVRQDLNASTIQMSEASFNGLAELERRLANTSFGALMFYQQSEYPDKLVGVSTLYSDLDAIFQYGRQG